MGSATLSTNAYDAYARLSSGVYGNGYRVRYVYDSLDRVKEIYQRATAAAAETLAYAFVYNSEGDLYELRNHRVLRSTFFEYDHAGPLHDTLEDADTTAVELEAAYRIWVRMKNTFLDDRSMDIGIFEMEPKTKKTTMQHGSCRA